MLCPGWVPGDLAQFWEPQFKEDVVKPWSAQRGVDPVGEVLGRSSLGTSIQEGLYNI